MNEETIMYLQKVMRRRDYCFGFFSDFAETCKLETETGEAAADEQ